MQAIKSIAQITTNLFLLVAMITGAIIAIPWIVDAVQVVINMIKLTYKLF